MLAALGFIPILGGLAAPVAFLWMLMTGVVAIRQALDFSTGKAVLTALLGLLPYGIALAILF